MNTHYILFQKIRDSYGETPVGVYDSLEEAEERQQESQQDSADEHNVRRHGAFTAGRSFSPAKKASDFKDDFAITEVLTP